MDLLALPKAELHCHLLGVIHPALLNELAAQGEPLLVAPETLNALGAVGNKTSFQQWVNVLKPYQQASWEAYRPILAHHIHELIRQGVVYTEIMISPLMFPDPLPELIAAFTRFRQWVNEAEQGMIQVEFLPVMPRTLSEEKIVKNTHDYIALYREGLIAGIAIVGLEDGSSIRRFSRYLLACREAGLGIEIHAGEHSGSESVAEAMEYGFANRIGHGLGLFRDAALVQRVAAAGIHLEFCLTSNLKCGCISCLDDHPLPVAQKNGISFSISTDDPGFFGCSLLDEYALLQQHFGFTEEDFQGLFYASMKARFEPKLRHANALSIG